jgi:hypothetical protein
MDKLKTPRGPYQEAVLNRLIQGCSKMVFGPLPVYLSSADTLNNQSLEYNISSFLWAGATAGFSKSKFMGFEIQVPNSQVNENQEFTVEFIVDEFLNNYALFREWVDVYRSTENRLDSNNPSPGADLIWDAQRAWCDFVDVWVVNNMNWPTAIIRYEEVFCTGIGPITMNFNSGEELKSTATFIYNRARIIRNPSDIEDVVQKTMLT